MHQATLAIERIRGASLAGTAPASRAGLSAATGLFAGGPASALLRFAPAGAIPRLLR